VSGAVTRDTPRPEVGMATQTYDRNAAKEPVVEIRSIDYVPLAERHGKPWHLGPVWFQGNAQLATLAVGLLGVSLGLNFIWAAIAIVLGVLVGTLFMAFHSAQGPKLGLPQMIQSRAQFGYYGALLPVVVAVLLFIGFNVFNTIIGGEATAYIVSASPSDGLLVPVALLALAVTLFGYQVIHIGLRWATWLFVAAYTVFFVGVLFTIHLPAGSFDLGKFDLDPFLVQFGAVVSYQLTWAPYVSEYSRYLPAETKTSTVFWWTYLGSAAGALMMVMGALILAPNPKLGPIEAVGTAADDIFNGFGTILMICSIPGLIAVTAMNMYSGGLSSLTTIDTVKKIRPTVLARSLAIGFIAVAGTVLAALLPEDFLGDFNNFLLAVLYFMIPWTAINLIDFFFVRHENYAIRELFKPHGLYGAWGWRGIVAYLVGFAAMIPFFSTTIYEGPVAKSLGGGDISPFIGFPIAAGLYYLFSRSIDVAAEDRVAESQRELLEREAQAQQALGTSDDDALLEDVGARTADLGAERHPGA
jgi:nucleobase:cation symporter-1, NCS1 family